MRIERALLWTALGAALRCTSALADGPPAGNPPPIAAVATPASRGSAYPGEPSLEATESAASKRAGGESADDASRIARARAAHFAPLISGKVGRTDTDQSRDGVQYQNPLHWTNVGVATSWAVTLTWDLPQAISSRDEGQLALSLIHLSHARQLAAERAGELYAQRRRRLAMMQERAAAPLRAQLETALDLLETTAALDAITGGLFESQLSRAQALTDSLSRLLHLEDLP